MKRKNFVYVYLSLEQNALCVSFDAPIKDSEDSTVWYHPETKDRLIHAFSVCENQIIKEI